jgi:outer membrane protein assembly factor BamB
MTRKSLLSALLAFVQCATLLRAAGESNAPNAWTDWRGGSARDAHSPYVPASLPKEVRFLWGVPLTGQSLGGVSADSRHVIVSDKSADLLRDVWRCLDAASGKPLWTVEYAAGAKMDYTSAPRASAVIHGDRVFLRGALGPLMCVDLASGRQIWTIDLKRTFPGEMPVWGFCAAPLVVGDRLVVNSCAGKAAMVALDCATGKIVWKTEGMAPGFGNFLLGTFGGRRQIVGHDKVSAGGWDPDTGRRLWTLRPCENEEFNVPTPVQVGTNLLLATEQSGTRLYAFRGDGAIEQTPVASSMELKPDSVSPVVEDGMVWGGCTAGLFCLDLSAGLRTVWQSDDPDFCDYVSLIAGNGRILVVTKKGGLALLPARPPANLRPEILRVMPGTAEFETELWSHPALVRGRLYLRSQDRVVCMALDAVAASNAR